jgi:hypothetical protein
MVRVTDDEVGVIDQASAALDILQAEAEDERKDSQ